jgi:hypothetical protein
MVLSDTYFVLNISLLLDALPDLEDLFLELQKRSTILILAHKLLKIKYRVSESVSSNPGEHFQQALNSATPWIFQGVSLGKDKVTNKTRLILQESL